MNEWFAFHPWLIALLALASLIAMIGIARHARRWKVALLLLQLLGSALLLGALLLRDKGIESGVIVLGANADMPISELLEMELPIVALPDAPLDLLSAPSIATRVERVADLATLRRRYPAVSHLHLIGDRLGPTDREAALSLDFSMQPRAPDSGADSIELVELDLPIAVSAGTHWKLSGRVRGDVDQLQLLDPAQRIVDNIAPDDDGRFSLGDLARAAGPSLYTLQLRRADTLVQSAPVPISSRSAPPMRALLLAAVPSAETKYLRRWATDAGMQLESRIRLAPTLSHGDAPRISAASFVDLDLLIVDERSWSTLRPLREELRAAIAAGMGLLLRITGPVPDAVLSDWQALGLRLQIADEPARTIRLNDAVSELDREPLHAWPVSINPLHAAPIWRDASGATLASQQPLGQGRIGAAWLSDSFVLVTRGERERHAALWSQLFAALAKARAEPIAQLPSRAYVGRRTTICSSSGAMQVQPPTSEPINLIVSPAANGVEHCAAFWPRAAGWHRLLIGPKEDASTNVSEFPFYVFSNDEAASLINAEDRQATAALVNRSDAPSASTDNREHWRRYALLAWLLLTALTWWLERRAQSSAIAARERS